MLTTDYYSHDHQQLLLPPGTRLVGSVQAVNSSQARKMVVSFHRAVCPDDRKQEEYETERIRREALLAKRQSTFERIVEDAPAMFTAAPLRVFLRAFINLEPYDFAEDVAATSSARAKTTGRPGGGLALTLARLPDEKLIGFAPRLALTGHTDIPRECDFDFRAEAESVFVPTQIKRGAAKKGAKTKPIGAKSDSIPKLTTKKTSAGRKKIAA